MDADGNPITAPPSEDVDQDFEIVVNVYRNDGSQLPGRNRHNWLTINAHFFGATAVKVLTAYEKGRRSINLTGTIKRHPKPVYTEEGKTVFVDSLHMYQPSYSIS